MDSARKGRALAGTYPPPSFRCHKLLVMIALLWLLQCCQAQYRRPVIFELDQRVKAKIGSDVKLLCIFYSKPKPYVVWSSEPRDWITTDNYLEKRPNIVNNFKYQATEKYVDGWSFMELLIRNVVQQDFGSYTCQCYSRTSYSTSEVTLLKDED